VSDIGFLIISLLAVIALASATQRLTIPYPVVLLLGGIAAGWLPGVPGFRLDPDLALVIFLAPVLFQAGFETSWRDFRANLVPIGMLAIGAVLVTMIAVGIAAHLFFPDMPWAVALTLGAIVAPPDAVAATSVFQKIGVPHQMRTIVEGESLVNDASALIAYRYTVAAVVSGHLALQSALTSFVLTGVLSIVAGLLIGWLLTRLLPHIDDPSLTIALTVIAPMPIYIASDEVGLSGVLVVVAAAIVVGRFSTHALSPRERLGFRSVWSTVLILLNSLVFLLIGLEFAEGFRELPGNTSTTLIRGALVISLVVIAARFAWVLTANGISRIIPSLRKNAVSWRVAIAISWSGLRGIVSVALAMALPLTLNNGDLFEWRTEVVFLAFVIIVVTLLGEGLTLPWLLRVLNLTAGDEELREEWIARREAATAALHRLDELADEPCIDPLHARVMRLRFNHWLELSPNQGKLTKKGREHIRAGNRLRNELLDAAREAVVEARNRGEIGDNARLTVEGDLDLEDERTIL